MIRKALFATALGIALCLPGGIEGPSPAGAQGAPARTERAIFAGGCFWSTERDLERLPGVVRVVSGFTGGGEANPTYAQVAGERTGHVEAVVVAFDPARISYGRLVRHFLRTIDPTDNGGQFCDRGANYRTAIFAIGPAQRREAEAALAEANRQLGGRVVTPVRNASRFFGAPPEHQDYAARNPERYAAYRRGCGKDARLREVWGSAT